MDPGAQAADGDGVAPDRAVSTDRPAPPLDDLVGFEHTLRLTSVDATSNRHRVYVLAWRPTLWGETTLVRTWGRRDRPGRSRTTVYADRDSARAEIRRLLRRRLRHGYGVVECR